MEGQRQNGKGTSRTVPVQQDFLFVDAAQAKTSRQGRRNARSFVMQKARRERPWSTSKHATKYRKHSGSTSPGSANTPDSLLLTPKTATPSPPFQSVRPDYFTALDHQPSSLVGGRICHDCQIFQCRPGQRLCPRCLLLKPVSPVEDPNNSLFDPFGTSPIEINATVSELLEHCKFATPQFHLSRRTIAECAGHRSVARLDWRTPWQGPLLNPLQVTDQASDRGLGRNTLEKEKHAN